MRDLLLAGDLNAGDIAMLIQFAHRYGGIEYAYGRMRAMQSEAAAILDQLPHSESKEAFSAIFDYIISRDK